MVLGLMSAVLELVTMVSSSWTVLPAALVVALATWMWWNRGRSREEREPETPGVAAVAVAAAGSAAKDKGGHPGIGAAGKPRLKYNALKKNYEYEAKTVNTGNVQQVWQHPRGGTVTFQTLTSCRFLEELPDQLN